MIQFARLERGVHGRYLNPEENGGQAAILISTSRKLGGEQAVWDTLVHETAHHAVYELCQADSGGHGPIFCNVANTMAERLGYDGAIRPETDDAIYWPGSLRPR